MTVNDVNVFLDVVREQIEHTIKLHLENVASVGQEVADAQWDTVIQSVSLKISLEEAMTGSCDPKDLFVQLCFPIAGLYLDICAAGGFEAEKVDGQWVIKPHTSESS